MGIFRQLKLILKLFSAAIAIHSNPSAAQSPPNGPLAAFDAVLTPWQTQDIDPEHLRAGRPHLAESWKYLNSSIFTSIQDLNQFSTTGLPINQTKRARQYQIGTFHAQSPFIDKKSRSPLIIEPRWCRIYDFHVIFISIADSTSNQLLASSHHAIATKQWSQMVQSRTLGQHLKTALKEQLDHLVAKPWAKASAQSALHLALTLKQENTRQNEGFSHCFALLMEEVLAPEYTIPRLLGADHMALLTAILPPNPKSLLRPTRTFLTHIFPQPPLRTKLPQALQFEFELSEAVFGKQTNTKKISPLTLNPPTISERSPKLLQWNWSLITPPLDSIEPLIKQESSALILKDLPSVVKIQGAWAYLDRGRAWGLHMGERLLTANGSIKGHVVRYYGPEEKLVSQRGFPIHEGAIIYIRKGQQSLRKGMLMEFDTTTYPTPWPPDSIKNR